MSKEEANRGPAGSQFINPKNVKFPFSLRNKQLGGAVVDSPFLQATA
ncbi:MAG TPA: hypothetical protein VFT72_19235 [Opitutaceae bacterium]|nr:hypothetical protein [Opitutaceae bacterium]